MAVQDVGAGAESAVDIIMISQVRAWCVSGEATRIREAAHLSKAELGRLVGTTGPTVSRWESCARRPQGAQAERYHRALTQLRQLDDLSL